MIPFIDLKRQYLDIKAEIDSAIGSVLDSGIFILGKNVTEFEKGFADYCGHRYCIGVANGTDALHLALRAHGIRPCDEVITVPNTAVPTVAAIEMAGAKPVFVDIDKDTYTIDTEKIEEKISSKTKAIIPVHLYGNVCDMDPIIKIAKKNSLCIIEDCAQAHASEYKGKKAPVSETGCFSFYPTKNLGCFGDGGAVVTDNKEIAQKIRMLRCYGEPERYKNEMQGFNSRLDELQAAILRVKLKHLDKWVDLRREKAHLYNELFKNSIVKIPLEKEYAHHAYHLYVIALKNRDYIKKKLESSGIAALIHYPLPIHFQKAYSHLGYKRGDFPVAEQACNEILSLPIYPELKEEEINIIVKQITKIS